MQLPNSQLHLLAQIDRRRRYRNWVTAFQIALVVFFVDQISKTWIAGHLAVGEHQAILGQTHVELTRVPTRGLVVERIDHGGADWLQRLAHALPGTILALLAIALWLRLRDAALGELIAFALAMAGIASNLISHSFSQTIVETLRLNLDGRFLIFNCADLASVLGGAVLLRRLTWTLFAEVRWQLTRQTG